MVLSMTFEEKLERVLCNRIDGCNGMVSSERLSGGASQETYRIVIKTTSGTMPLALRRAAGGLYRVKDPNLHDTRPGLDGEAMLMEVARSAGVPAPKIYHVLTREDDIGDGFFMEWLDGEALGSRILRDDQFAGIRPTLAYECGRIMARIHGIDIEKSGLGERLSHITPEEFVSQTWGSYQLLEVPQPMIDYTGRWLMDNIPDQYNPTLVHNEFRNGNFMVTSEGIVGILDWEIAHIGDPMRDLGWICTNAWRYGESLPVGGFGTYEELFRGYEEVSGLSVDPGRVKFWEVFGSFWWSIVCLTMVERFRNGPDRSIERAVIGRRTSEGQVDCVNLLMPGPVIPLEIKDKKENLEMPGVDELLSETSEFLRTIVMNETSGRTRFLARVAANATDIVLREQEQANEYRNSELSSLQSFYHSDDDLVSLRWRLVRALREGIQPLEDDALKVHLRNMAAYQIAIDNPRYSGLIGGQFT